MNNNRRPEPDGNLTQSSDSESENEDALQAALREMVETPDIDTDFYQPIHPIHSQQTSYIGDLMDSLQQNASLESQRKWLKAVVERSVESALPSYSSPAFSMDATVSHNPREHCKEESLHHLSKANGDIPAESETWEGSCSPSRQSATNLQMCDDNCPRGWQIVRGKVRRKNAEHHTKDPDCSTNGHQMRISSNLMQYITEVENANEQLKFGRIEAASVPKSSSEIQFSTLGTQTSSSSLDSDSDISLDTQVLEPNQPTIAQTTSGSFKYRLAPELSTEQPPFGSINILTVPFRQGLEHESNIWPVPSDKLNEPAIPRRVLSQVLRNVPLFSCSLKSDDDVTNEGLQGLQQQQPQPAVDPFTTNGSPDGKIISLSRPDWNADANTPAPVIEAITSLMGESSIAFLRNLPFFGRTNQPVTVAEPTTVRTMNIRATQREELRASSDDPALLELAAEFAALKEAETAAKGKAKGLRYPDDQPAPLH